MILMKSFSCSRSESQICNLRARSDPGVDLWHGNIMTNTITCVKTPAFLSGIPVLTTNHVVYTSDFKDPRIATYGSTAVMLQQAAERTKDQPGAFIVSLIKQLIHIGTDFYTPCGIQIPGANLILSIHR